MAIHGSEGLFINPYMTVARASKQLGVSAPTAQKAIDRLASVGMLKESTGREWGRTWLAHPILDAVNDAPMGAKNKEI